MITATEAYKIVKEKRNQDEAAEKCISEIDSLIRQCCNIGDIDLTFKVDKTKDIYQYFTTGSFETVINTLNDNGYTILYSKEENGKTIVLTDPRSFEIWITWDKDNLSSMVG